MSAFVPFQYPPIKNRLPLNLAQPRKAVIKQRLPASFCGGMAGQYNIFINAIDVDFIHPCAVNGLRISVRFTEIGFGSFEVTSWIKK
jgi:hypothetical protein